MKLCLLSMTMFSLAAVTAAAQAPVSFRADIAPILLEKCLACHGAKKAEGGYRVDTFAHLLTAGDSELTSVTGGKPGESEALRRIASDDADVRMPAEGDALAAAQVALVKRWIEAGAKYDGGDEHAPLAAIVPPPVHPDPPEVYPHTLPITALAFRQNEDVLELYVGGYYEITVWNAADGMLLRRIKNEGQRTYALKFGPNSQSLAAASGSPGKLGELRLFDPTSGELLKVQAQASEVMLDAAFSPDGRRIAMAAADNTLRVFDVESGKQQLLINSHSDWVNAVAWSADGRLLVSGSRDKTAKVFNSESRESVITYTGHDAPVGGVAFHPDGKQVYSSSADGRIHLWNIADAKKTADVANFGGEVFKLNTAGDRFIAGSADKSARLFELLSKKQLREFKDLSESVLSAAISPDGKQVATGTFDGRVTVFNAENGEMMASFLAAPGYVTADK